MQEQARSLVIIDQNIPLADSREIADRLGITHRSFFRMVTEYQEEIEKDFGQLRFEITVGYRVQGGGNPTKYALLTEDQIYAYMSYSQNTERARHCKRQLVKAFAEARQLVAQRQTIQIDKLATVLAELVEPEHLDTLIGRLQGMRGVGTAATPLIPRRLPTPHEADTPQWEAFLSTWKQVFGKTWITMTQFIAELQSSEDTSPLIQALPRALQTACDEA